MKILCIIDRPGWCWETAAKEVKQYLDHKHDIDIIPAAEINTNVAHGSYDLIWSRALPEFYPYGGDLAAPYLFSFTTGNELIQPRLPKLRPYLKKADGVICQNTNTSNVLRSVAPNKCKIYNIPNGINLRKFQNFTPPTKPIIGMAANTTLARANLKGLPYVQVAAKNLGMQIITTGKAPKPPYLPDTVHDSMPNFYNSIKYYAQPSHSEGCSNSVREAMACGRICLILKGVGYHGEECIGDLNNPAANVVWIRRDPSDIADKLRRLEADPELCARISCNARKFAEEWCWSRVAGMLDQAFEDIIARSKK